MRIERDVRRMQQICAYVMKHYVHPIALDDIAAEVGMNRSAFWLLLQAVQGDDLFAVRYAIPLNTGLASC